MTGYLDGINDWGAMVNSHRRNNELEKIFEDSELGPEIIGAIGTYLRTANVASLLFKSKRLAQKSRSGLIEKAKGNKRDEEFSFAKAIYFSFNNHVNRLKAKQLDLSLNNLMASHILDLSFTHISDQELQSLFEIFPFIQKLDLKNCRDLTTLNLSKVPNLKWLNLGQTKLENIDLSGCNKIEYLNLDGQSSIKKMVIIGDQEQHPKFPNLRMLVLKYTGLSYNEIKKFIQEAPNLEYLNIPGHGLNFGKRYTAAQLAELVRLCPKLEVFNFSVSPTSLLD